MPKYHLRLKDRAITDEGEIKRLLREGKFITIALCRDNEPYIVTINYGYAELKHALYFHCAGKGLKLEFIKQNPEVCATILEDMGYQERICTHFYQTLVIRGKLNIVENLEEKKYGMDVLLEHLEKDPDKVRKKSLQDEERYRTTGVLRLDIEEITGKQNVPKDA